MKITQKISLAYVRGSLKVLEIFSKRAAAAKAFKVFCTPFRVKPGKSSIVFDHAESLTVTVENKKARGRRWNPQGLRKVLILHGMHSSSRNFERYVQPLVDNGFQVFAFDAPAHGESEGNQITVIQYRKLIAEIYNNYGPIHCYLAHSFGGLSLSLALEMIPHDASTRVVLIAPATETVTAIDQFLAAVGLGPEVRKHFDQIIIEKGGHPPSWYSIKRAIRQLQAQILWFQDRQDEVTPFADVQSIIDADYPNIEFVITENLGHRRIYRDQQNVNRAVNFLSK